MPFFHYPKEKKVDVFLERRVKCELCDFTTTTFKKLKDHKADTHAY